MRALLPYVATQAAAGVPMKSIIRHILGLFNGLPGARAWRRHLSEAAYKTEAGAAVIEEALEYVMIAQASRPDLGVASGRCRHPALRAEGR